jgi:thiol-disulfide isomerase/thioredoxin
MEQAMNRRWLVIVAAAVVMTLSGWAMAEPAKLGVGDAAPPLSVAKWVKGEPVKEFEKGKVYVIECWATWCGPCRAAIPHVTAMQKKFQDKGVVIIGMNVWEKDDAAVEPFVQSMGDKMGYRVATDAPSDNPESGKTATAWLVAAGRNGIPCSFVVDKAGKIAWVGHPMDGLERVIGLVADGTFDARKEAELAAKIDAIQEKAQAAIEAEKWDAAIAALDEMIALKPENSAAMQVGKFRMLLVGKKDTKAAYELANKLAVDLKDDADSLGTLAWTMMGVPGAENRDPALALKMATRANELTKGEDVDILDTLARAQFENGDAEAAVKTETAALEKADDPLLKAQLQKKLDKYKAKKAK